VRISNIKRYRVGESKHNTLLRCKVSPGRQYASALYYKAIIRSDKVKTKRKLQCYYSKGPKHIVYPVTPYTVIKCCVLTHPPDIFWYLIL